MSRLATGVAIFILAVGLSQAQSADPADRWLAKNYRFTGPPPAGELAAVDPVLNQLRQIQAFTMAILQNADFEEDYWTALYAAQQAADNAQLIGAITARLQAMSQASPAMHMVSSAQADSKPPIYLIAHKDGDIHAATSYWYDGLMLHSITLEGAHEQIRLDLVDTKFSVELNRSRKVDFHLPEEQTQSR